MNLKKRGVVLVECVIYLTHACNMECTYCYEGREKGNEYLSIELVDHIIDYILGINGNNELSITFLGGEPLLNVKWIYSFIEGMEGRNIKNVKYKTTTNGVLLEKDIIDYFKKKKFQLSISIDGDRESNELNRKPKLIKVDCYGKMIENIRYLNYIDYQFNIRMTIARNTVSRLCDNVKYLYGLRIKNIRISIDRFADWSKEDLHIFDEQMDKLDNFYLNKYFENEQLYIDIYDDEFGFFIPKRKIRFCSAGTKNHIVINSIGDIFPCSYVTNDEYWKIGDIYSGIDEIKRYKKILESLNENTRCKTCEIAHCCIGTKCGFFNYAKNGFINGIDDITCEIERIIIRHSKRVFLSLLEAGDSRILNMIQYCKENSIEMIL